MGIPSYFSYIVKNHSNIIKPIHDYPLKITHFYLDSNSIIYDVIKKHENPTNQYIIDQVIIQICDYIKCISPSKVVYIAFDGVAPVAKLEQQRQRRYKSWYQNEITESIDPNHKKGWNTIQITPGTQFMNELNIGIKQYFSKPSQFGLEEIIVTTSQEPGEGEHKIFDYIRNLPKNNHFSHIIYGLDADLIMLCINHLPIFDKIYLFRETPEFIKSIHQELEPNKSYLLNIPELAKVISLNMNEQSIPTDRIYDYIFLCFFLGNDFMPHFPSVNIRTSGIDRLLNGYKVVIGKKNKILTDGKIIYWDNLLLLFKWLSIHEEDFFKEEMELRNKREKHASKMPNHTIPEKLKRIENIPNYDRTLEKYIDPHTEDWKERYYMGLFQLQSKDLKKEIPNIVLNYLEGLQWTMSYYTSGCVDWRWKYKYNYAPLFCDLYKYSKQQVIRFQENTKAVDELTQLCYVIPKSSFHIIPHDLTEKLLEKSYLYPDNCSFIWAFCRYFWESHAILPEIDIDWIENIVNERKL
jgi:5'-3' exonuclease